MKIFRNKEKKFEKYMKMYKNNNNESRVWNPWVSNRTIKPEPATSDALND